MALEVGIVGLPSSGKSLLFHALTGSRATGDVGMAAIPDERLPQLAEVVHARKVTPAAIRVVEVRGTGPALLGNVDSGRTLGEWDGELPGELEPLTTKPLIAIENGPGGIDLQLEAELG